MPGGRRLGRRDQGSLNSERIKQEFGSFGIEVIECSAERRVASLYSLESGARVCRTYADVAFNVSVVPELAVEHALVLAGQSIGAVFKQRGWSITKRHTQIGSVTLTRDDSAILSRMCLEPPQRVARHSYVFEVGKDDSVFDYATITERHHPCYLTAADLKAIYGELRYAQPGRASAG
jgi:hypothetical protein